MSLTSQCIRRNLRVLEQLLNLVREVRVLCASLADTKTSSR